MRYQEKAKILILTQYCSYLQEALHVLQQVQATVAAVVLQRDLTESPANAFTGKTSSASFPNLPFHLQVPEGWVQVTFTGKLQQ